MAGCRVALAAGALAIAACAPSAVPSVPPLATSVESRFEGRAMVFTVTPWPLDATVAFLCRRRPGSEFTVANPHPADGAGCVPVEASTSGEILKVRFDATALDLAVAQQFNASGPPWFLAIAGRRGPFSAATVLAVINSPLFSPPGPS